MSFLHITTNFILHYTSRIRFYFVVCIIDLYHETVGTVHAATDAWAAWLFNARTHFAAVTVSLTAVRTVETAVDVSAVNAS